MKILVSLAEEINLCAILQSRIGMFPLIQFQHRIIYQLTNKVIVLFAGFKAPF
jgi:hypothetical protein